METVTRNGDKIIAFDNKAIYYSDEEEYLKKFKIYNIWKF